MDVGSNDALGRIWLAAHYERKLSKSQFLQTNIESSITAILENNSALRMSGQLLLGVTRIYSRKAKYLYDDCNDIAHKIRMAFKPVALDLPFEQQNSSHHAHAAETLADAMTEIDITAREYVFDLAATLQSQQEFAFSQTRPQDITIAENSESFSIEAHRRISTNGAGDDASHRNIFDLGDLTTGGDGGAWNLDLNEGLEQSFQIQDETMIDFDQPVENVSLELEVGREAAVEAASFSPANRESFGSIMGKGNDPNFSFGADGNPVDFSFENQDAILGQEQDEFLGGDFGNKTSLIDVDNNLLDFGNAAPSTTADESMQKNTKRSKPLAKKRRLFLIDAHIELPSSYIKNLRENTSDLLAKDIRVPVSRIMRTLTEFYNMGADHYLMRPIHYNLPRSVQSLMKIDLVEIMQAEQRSSFAIDTQSQLLPMEASASSLRRQSNQPVEDVENIFGDYEKSFGNSFEHASQSLHDNMIVGSSSIQDQILFEEGDVYNNNFGDEGLPVIAPGAEESMAQDSYPAARQVLRKRDRADDDVEEEKQSASQTLDSSTNDGFSPSTAAFLDVLKDQLDSRQELLFEDVCARGVPGAAKMFFELLVLQSKGFIRVTQDVAFGDMKIRAAVGSSNGDQVER